MDKFANVLQDVFIIFHFIFSELIAISTKIILFVRSFSKGTAGVPPKIIEDRSIDDSGVDGVGLLMTQNRCVSFDGFKH